jgi:hypothetical protein
MSAEAYAGQPTEISRLPRRATRFQRSGAADLAVTTGAANRAGREIWGYNKFVTAIDAKCDGKKFSATVHDPRNALIAMLEGTRGASVPVAPTDIYTFSLFGGK